jgi:uncharacterized protein YndB with AHSA1/START domain
MLNIVLLGLAAAIVVILIAAATRPDTLTVRRSTTIAAPPERIYPLLDDFQAWSTWSPWEKLDPAMKKTFAGPARGRHSSYAWDGNNKAGAGRMEITDTSAPTRLTITLDFTRPFKAHNTVELALEPRSGATTVVWTMTGAQSFMSKLFGLFVNMDRLLGNDFETGLANLKALVEK